jgi:hypothetical protein
MNNFSKLVIVAIFTVCSVAAFAASKQSTIVTFTHETTVAGVKVPAGDYKLVVERDGANAKVTLSSGKTVVSVNAHFEDLKTFSGPNAVITGANDSVARIEVSRMKGAVVFDAAAPAAGGK